MNEPSTTKERYLASLAQTVLETPNLRALVLRLADDDDLSGSLPITVYEVGGSLKLLLWSGHDRLSDLGHEVAELVRPARWRIIELADADNVIGPSGFAFPVHHLSDGSIGLAKRVVDLLNADDLAAAKRYEASP
jgi:hypothetical protein